MTTKKPRIPVVTAAHREHVAQHPNDLMSAARIAKIEAIQREGERK